MNTRAAMIGLAVALAYFAAAHFWLAPGLRHQPVRQQCTPDTERQTGDACHVLRR